MVKLFATLRAGWIDLQERLEHLARAASWAFAGEAVEQVLGEGIGHDAA